tara:strand:+ start:267 stop:464 length:198 start_codon:yes stop_codon:yes gene_type:complete
MDLQKRIRVAVNRSVKGVITGDHTVEITASYQAGEAELDLKAMILAESDQLQASLSKRYPVKEEK